MQLVNIKPSSDLDTGDRNKTSSKRRSAANEADFEAPPQIGFIKAPEKASRED